MSAARSQRHRDLLDEEHQGEGRAARFNSKIYKVTIAMQ
jgi:hypothetical protein